MTRTLTPVRETEHHWNPRTKRVEVFGAVSVEEDESGRPLWDYARVEDGYRTIWQTRRSGAEPPVFYSSLPKARMGTASGSADRMLARLAAEAVR